MKTYFCIHRGIARALAVLPLALLLTAGPVFGHSWQKLVSPNGFAPSNAGVMLLLSDGNVMVNVNNDMNGGSAGWYLLSPDSYGNYTYGAWTALSPMHDTRLFFSAQVLPDGRVYVAGGEYGAGGATAEIYDPLSDPLYPGHKAITASDPWTYINPPTSLLNPAVASQTTNGNQAFLDAGSELLPDGTVLEAPVGARTAGDTLLYSTVNGWSDGPTLANGATTQDEASWVKLPDDSILTIGPFNQTTQRFIPASTGGTGTWVADKSVPVVMYDSILGETGPGNLLPNGNAFFSGGTGNTVIYTPTGSASQGSWTQGPGVPQGLAPQDAPSAMMNNGKILCGFSPIATGTAKSKSYQPPTSFFEYDYSAGPTGAFTEVGAPFGTPGGPNNLNQAPLPSFKFEMLDLPDGEILMSDFSADLYVYYPDDNTNSTVSSLAPTIASVTRANDGSYLITGTLLNGISEGANYGDDAQMSTNYPIVFLANGVNGSNVYYARTRHWSSTGVRKTGQTVTTEFDVPANLPTGNYSLYVEANGLRSASYPFTYSSPIVWVDFYYTGTQNGTFAQPFNTVAAAVNAVASGGVIQIEDGGTTSETPTITKAVSIYSYSGGATIGQSAGPVKNAKTSAIVTTPRIGTAGAVISGSSGEALPLRMAPR
jgi:hypothetical protein